MWVSVATGVVRTAVGVPTLPINESTPFAPRSSAVVETGINTAGFAPFDTAVAVFGQFVGVMPVSIASVRLIALVCAWIGS